MQKKLIKLTEKNKSQLLSKLLIWYYNQSKEYPWRLSTDPYAIWLSEVMLQQTRVDTAIPYYHRWLQSFPNVQSVANTSIDHILKTWEGLGYYNRAKNFHKSCQIIIKDYGGSIPQDLSSFKKLPGVGDYIAAAVMSIAFNMEIPTMDVNAIRVISRLFSIGGPITQAKKKIIKKLSVLIDSKCPGDFNQAIMDLGREICTFANPNCNLCPMKNYCLSYVNSAVNNYPLLPKKRIKPNYNVSIGVIWKNGKILVSKRMPNKLLGGLWEFPGGKVKKGETSKECLAREVLEELDISIKINSFIKTIKHSYSHFSITMDAYHCAMLGGSPRAIQCASYRWISPLALDTLAFPSSSHKLFNDIQSYVLN